MLFHVLAPHTAWHGPHISIFLAATKALVFLQWVYVEYQDEIISVNLTNYYLWDLQKHLAIPNPLGAVWIFLNHSSSLHSLWGLEGHVRSEKMQKIPQRFCYSTWCSFISGVRSSRGSHVGMERSWSNHNYSPNPKRKLVGTVSEHCCCAGNRPGLFHCD